MKKGLFLLLTMLAIIVLPSLSFADRSEQARVIKVDLDNQDIIVERLDGSRWVMQYNRVCQSMTSEFPVTLIIKNGEISRLKVAFNEICNVYKSYPFSGEAKIKKLYKSKNLIIADHEGDIEWKNKLYKIDYSGVECDYIYKFIDSKVYLSLSKDKDQLNTMLFPGNQGGCKFRFTETQDITLADKDEALSIKGLDFQAQSNQVYFYWEPEKSLKKPLYVLSYSKFKLNTDDYLNWREMPNARIISDNSYTVNRLANGQRYYFYIAALNKDLKAGNWSELKVAPVAPPREKGVIEGEEERFEVTVTDGGDYFLLNWNKDELARRYFIRFYVNGRQKLYKIIKTDTREWKIPKKEEYYGKGLRFTVRTLPKKPFWPRQKDGVYWEYNTK